MKLKVTVRTDVTDLYRGIIEYKKCYRCVTNTIKYRKGDFTHVDFDRWRNYLCELLKLHGISDCRKIDIQATEH